MADAASWSPDGRARRLRRHDDNVQPLAHRPNNDDHAAWFGGPGRCRERTRRERGCRAQRLSRAARECQCQRQGFFGRTVYCGIGRTIRRA